MICEAVWCRTYCIKLSKCNITSGFGVTVSICTCIWKKINLLRQWRLSKTSKLFITYFVILLYDYVSSRRQNNDYSPHVVKHRRLDSTSYPVISSPLIRTPPPRHPDQVVAGSSRSDYDRSYSSSHSHPHPEVSAVPESSNSLQTYAKDKVLYIQTVLGCILCARKYTWFSQCACVCGLSWAVRWWSCLRHASSKLPIWPGRRCAELDCSKTYSASMQVWPEYSPALLLLSVVIIIH